MAIENISAQAIRKEARAIFKEVGDANKTLLKRKLKMHDKKCKKVILLFPPHVEGLK